MTDILTTKTYFTPTTELEEGETILARFKADKATYWRENAWLAAIAMVLGMGVLWVMGNPHVWTGAIGGLAAIAVRSFYLASDEVKMEWHLTNRRLLGPGPRAIAHENIETVRSLMSAVQIITVTGDKHLLKYQADTADTVAQINRARGAGETE
ncbi:MAG: hypothetical protein AAF376_01700 [Pseudomonadota bacterium]